MNGAEGGEASDEPDWLGGGADQWSGTSVGPVFLAPGASHGAHCPDSGLLYLCGRVVGVDGSSMEPTLRTEIWSLLQSIGYQPRQHDVVVC